MKISITVTTFMLYLLPTTSEFMAVNLRGQGRSPEAKDGLHKFDKNEQKRAKSLSVQLVEYTPLRVCIIATGWA